MLSPEEKVALVVRHAECEYSADWDGALATMTDSAVYEHFPSGLRVTGRDALVAGWKRGFETPGVDPTAMTAGTTLHFVTGETVVLAMDWVIDKGDGVKTPSRSFAVFDFAGDLIQRESTFADDATAALLGAAFSERFLNEPGVTPIPESAMTPSAGEKMAVMGRQGECKARSDWEGALATMTDHGSYEIYPLGLRIAGGDALVDQWRRVFKLPEFAPEVLASAKTSWWETGDSLVLLADQDVDVDGVMTPSRSFAVLNFEDGRVKRETIYVDQNMAAVFERAFTAEFLSLPGVERI